MPLLPSASDGIFSGVFSGYGISYDSVPQITRMDARVGFSGVPGPAGGFGGSSPPDAPPIETVRTFFPETWIWDLVEVG